MRIIEFGGVRGRAKAKLEQQKHHAEQDLADSFVPSLPESPRSPEVGRLRHLAAGDRGRENRLHAHPGGPHGITQWINENADTGVRGAE